MSTIKNYLVRFTFTVLKQWGECIDVPRQRKKANQIELICKKVSLVLGEKADFHEGMVYLQFHAVYNILKRYESHIPNLIFSDKGGLWTSVDVGVYDVHLWKELYTEIESCRGLCNDLELVLSVAPSLSPDIDFKSFYKMFPYLCYVACLCNPLVTIGCIREDITELFERSATADPTYRILPLSAFSTITKNVGRSIADFSLETTPFFGEQAPCEVRCCHRNYGTSDTGIPSSMLVCRYTLMTHSSYDTYATSIFSQIRSLDMLHYYLDQLPDSADGLILGSGELPRIPPFPKNKGLINMCGIAGYEVQTGMKSAHFEQRVSNWAIYFCQAHRYDVAEYLIKYVSNVYFRSAMFAYAMADTMSLKGVDLKVFPYEGTQRHYSLVLSGEACGMRRSIKAMMTHLLTGDIKTNTIMGEHCDDSVRGLTFAHIAVKTKDILFLDVLWEMGETCDISLSSNPLLEENVDAPPKMALKLKEYSIFRYLMSRLEQRNKRKKVVGLYVNTHLVQHRGATKSLLSSMTHFGDIKAIQILINEFSADLENVDSIGYTPVHWAARSADTSILEFLIGLNVNLSGVSRKQRTLFHKAGITGTSAAIRILLNAGVDPSFRDINGKTALDLAMDEKKYDYCQEYAIVAKERGIVYR